MDTHLANANFGGDIPPTATPLFVCLFVFCLFRICYLSFDLELKYIFNASNPGVL